MSRVGGDLFESLHYGQQSIGPHLTVTLANPGKDLAHRARGVTSFNFT